MTVATLNRLIRESNAYFINNTKIPIAKEIIKIENYLFKKNGTPFEHKKGYEIYFKCKKQIEHFIVGASYKEENKLPERIILYNY